MDCVGPYDELSVFTRERTGTNERLGQNDAGDVTLDAWATRSKYSLTPIENEQIIAKSPVQTAASTEFPFEYRLRTKGATNSAHFIAGEGLLI